MSEDNLFIDYVSNSRKKLKSNKPKWFIIGNESADIDSVSCSLVYGFYKQMKNGVSCDVIPVINCSKEVIGLKKDIIEWLKNFHIIDLTELVYTEDIMNIFNDLNLSSNLKITLVDHQRPTNDTYLKYIKEVIDHRESYYKYSSNQLEVQNIKVVGSCSTIIASYILQDRSIPNIAVVLKLLYGAILLDTNCLDTSISRTTKMDIDTLNEIDILLSLTEEDRQHIYQILYAAKSNNCGLTFIEILRKDLKFIQVSWKNSKLKIAIPVLLNTDVKDIITVSNIEDQLQMSLNNLNANILIILTCGTDVFHRRGCILFSQNMELIKEIKSYLCESKLKFQHFPSTVVALVVNDLSITRKLFIPVIENYFSRESFKFQSNNCNIHLRIEEIDNNSDEDEVEREGAPYTLSTPKCSCSGSPDTRNLGMNLPSLNNRRTLALIDQKRQRHFADLDIVDSVEEEDKNIEDDVSPLVYTPENSGEEDSSSENLTLVQLTDKLTVKKKKIVSTNNPALPLEKSIYDIKERDENLGCWSETLDNLSLEVNKRRHKLETNNLDSLINVMISDVISNSEKIIEKDKLSKKVLKKWSDSYSEKEKMNFLKLIDNSDMNSLADFLTTGLIRDCLSEFDVIAMTNEKECNNSAIITDLDENQNKFSGIDFVESDDENDDSCIPDSTIPDLEINYNSCPVGTIINKEIQGVSNCVNSANVDVENSSFNLYRRISNNQLDFTDDEKKLLAIAGNWYPEEDVIYSDGEQEINSVPDNETDITKKLIYPNKEISVNLTKM